MRLGVDREASAAAGCRGLAVAWPRVFFGRAGRTEMKIRIRTATEHDADGWSRLRAESWPEKTLTWHRREVEAWWAAPRGVVVLAEAQEGVVGFAEVSLRREYVEGVEGTPVPYLEGWYVIRSRRGQGIGRALLRYVEHWAAGQGYRELASDAEVGNALAVYLHGRVGFREAGRSVHFVKVLQTLEPPRE